jgi:uncharacterized protein YjbI with pentapeptide repeats
MDIILQEDQTFENIDYSEKKLPKTEFDNCVFINCDFSKSDLSCIDFMDCRFDGCRLSLAVLDNTRIKNINFRHCKLMGVDFSKCDNFLFAASFENCQMDYCSFFRKKMKNTSFVGCSLKEVDFTETDLTMAVFDNCDLIGAVFMGTMLEKTDFRTATNYAFDPELNRIKKAKFSEAGVSGLLTKYNIDIG